MAKVVKERVWGIKDYIREDTTGTYSLSNLFKQHGSYTNAVEKGAGEFQISCPFHSDSTPSLYLNDEKGTWNCFSCGRGGDYLSLFVALNQDVGGFYDGAQRVLRTDTRMRMLLGFESIYMTDGQDDSWNRESEIVRPKLRGNHMPASYLALARKQKKEGVSKEQAQRTILAMQAGFELNVFYGIQGGEVKTEVEVEVMDLDSL